MANYQAILKDIYTSVSIEKNEGAVAQYIPELAKIDPQKFGVYFSSTLEENFGLGDWDTKFSIQSISKVLSLSLAYNLLGDQIWERVGVEPSGNAFNSLVQLESDAGIPRNPLINAGAMVICDLLVSRLDNPKADFLKYLKGLGSSDTVGYSSAIAQSELSVGYRNIAMCNFLKSFGNIHNDPEEVLDFYFNMCSIEMNCKELTQTFTFLKDSSFKTYMGEAVLTSSQTKRVNAIMQTCGFYDESGEFSFKVGLPGKSGVGGGIVAIYPEKYAITVWSPRLNKKGNSYRGMKFLEQFTTKTRQSIF